MVPSALVFLEALPLTVNGKVDRKALPAPEATVVEDGYAPPRTPLEEGLCEIWSEVLRVDRVGIHANFFELGGHSLLATQVISRIRTTFQVDLPLGALFEAPTVAGLAERIVIARGEERVATQELVRVSREQPLPLSFSQQRLWFLDQLEPGSPLYNVPSALRLTGPLNVAALQQSLTEIVHRHESLRTTFALVDGEAVQVIRPAETLPLPIVDLHSLEPATRQEQARQLIDEEAQRPFDLEQGPLFRASLLKLDDQEHILLLSLHHIVSDGWSQGVLRREFVALYRACCNGLPSGLPDLPLQYADYAAWQRQWLQGEALARQLAYWKAHLAGAPTLLDLPTDRPRPPMQSFRGSRQSFQLSQELTSSLVQLAQREGATLFMTLLAAFQTLLMRYSGQEHIVVGTPIANRTHEQLEGLIGLFMNTLALRGDLSGDPRFTDLLSRVRDSALGAYAHQDLPFEKLVEELQPTRSLSHSPVFQVMLILQNAPRTSLEFEGVQLQAVGGEAVTAKFDLSLTLAESGGNLRGALEYNTDLFDAERIERMLAHFQTLLEAIVADPQQRLSRLPLLTEAERHQTLIEWNDTAADYPSEQRLHQLFEEQALRIPDAIAVEFDGQSLTYAELNARANQLAHTLVKQGVGPEVLVGICMERSIDIVIAILGVLKAGGAYVPLDPAYPRERLRYYIEDSGTSLILSHERLALALDQTEIPVVALDRDWNSIKAEPAQNLTATCGPGNLAYVIYTSGSTGQPKGVAIEHRSVVALVTWARGLLSAHELSGVVLATSICFDLSVYELFVTLCGGGRVILVANALAIADLGADVSPRLLNTVPSAMAELVRQGALPATVVTVNLAGEPLTRGLVDAIYANSGVEKVYDLYGPSEDTTYSTWALRERGGRETIGRPISNTQLYLLDRCLQVVPVGVSGEIYIGGDGLARGYLNRGDLTAEKFVADPFSSKAGARMYRTGDLARYLPDGNIELLGRVDHQVKVRGFRIELGEIENVLAAHPQVREAVVLAREDHPGEKRLVAYLVGCESGLTVEELREHLKSALPEYMIPTMFVFLETLPLSPNGKVDRRALPVPEASGRDEEYLAPRTPIEEGLVEIWSEVLRADRIGVHDSFFALGGHSLLATQVISRIRSTFQVDVPLRALFEAPTVSQLAARIEIATGAVKQDQEDDMARLLAEVEQLSTEEVLALLSQ
jgi:amino acid adenylation domain-containing protein